ncbi:MAG: hypothetical protein ACFFAN_00875 [Promethearchaeota archaeon]
MSNESNEYDFFLKKLLISSAEISFVIVINTLLSHLKCYRLGSY